jgi:hypothetical protein
MAKNTSGLLRGGPGRPKGVPNKATAEIRALCQQHGPAMVESLVQLARTAQSEQARVAAIRELLDRGYGRSAPAVDADEAPQRTVPESVTFVISVQDGDERPV